MKADRHPKGRSSGLQTPNRFEKLRYEPLEVELTPDDDGRPTPTKFYIDNSKTILSKNDSPDLPFNFSINPYRGCEHGCIYCYARPSHEYLGFSAGLDFESKIMVKPDAPELLEQALKRKSWRPQIVAFSGNTDCYQPIERKLQITRKCLGVFLKFRNPVSVISKNALILRDADILQEMARLNLVHVMLSITTLDAVLARIMEPRTSSPAQRLATIEELVRLGIPAGVNVAPVIPGLTDEEMPSILKAAADHGATNASYILLKLPGAVQVLFADWVERTMPGRAGKILNRIRDTRDGELTDSRFGTRMTGEGGIARSIADLFAISARRNNLQTLWGELATTGFMKELGSQLEIFP